MKGKKVAIAAGVAAGLGGLALILLSRKSEAAPPEEPEEPEPGMAKLYGRVTSSQTGNGVAGVKVTTTGAITLTDSAGDYSTNDIPPGTWSVRFEKDGFETKQFTISLAEGNNEFNVQLVPVGAPPGAEFKVSDLVISPEEVNPGQPVTISCLVTNIGSEAGSYTVQLGGDFMAQQTVTLQPGESKSVSFQVTAPAGLGSYNVNVDGLFGSFSVVEEAVADIRVEDLVIEPREVNVGETVTISVVATNYGAAAGSKTITCTVS